jgi:hypothetical protein
MTDGGGRRSRTAGQGLCACAHACMYVCVGVCPRACLFVCVCARARGSVKTRRRCGSGEPNPDADVARVSPSWCRCGTDEPSPGADVAAAIQPESRCRCGRSEPSPCADAASPSVPHDSDRYPCCYGCVGQRRQRGHWLARSIDQLRCRLRRAHLCLVLRQHVIAATDTRDPTPTAQPIQAAGDSGS